MCIISVNGILVGDCPTAVYLQRIFYRKEEPLHESTVKIKLQPALYSERVRDAVEALDAVIDEELRKQHLIGRVQAVPSNVTGRCHIKRKCVTFTWQRGIKIGQGRFGKVYTAVNNSTGEMMAMKEIALQHNDTSTIRRVAEELKILEGVSHRNLVKYYGIEVHRVSIAKIALQYTIFYSQAILSKTLLILGRNVNFYGIL